MGANIETMGEYLLTELKTEKVSEGVIYEFVSACYKTIQENHMPKSNNVIEKLWNYLSLKRIASMRSEQEVRSAFRQGQLFTAVELVKMMQDSIIKKDELIEDAKKYNYWSPVFLALSGGRTLTHKELSKVTGLSISSLSQFFHKIEAKQYIQCRKVGRTKYYRLSEKGKRILELMREDALRISPGVTEKQEFFERLLWLGTEKDGMSQYCAYQYDNRLRDGIIGFENESGFKFKDIESKNPKNKTNLYVHFV